MNKTIRYQYETEEEREQLMLENVDNRLIAIENLFEGKFLTFDDLAQEKYISQLENQILLMANEATGGIL